MTTRLGKLVLVALLVLCGCPRRFDPRAETVKGSPDPEADHLYREARGRLEIGDLREARDRFADFLQRYPNDPLAASARLGQARAALGLGEAKQAQELVEPLAAPAGATAAPANEDPTAEPTRAKARWLYGLALHQTGDYQRSRELLRPFASAVGGADAAELHAVLADDAAHLGDLEDALREYELFFPQARPAERLYLREHAAELVAKLSPGEALRIWTALQKDGLAAAVLGRRVAADRRAAGDEAMALEILDESRAARERVGFEEAHVSQPERAPAQRAVGLLLPMSGRARALGDRALKGALLSAELTQTGGLPAAPPLELRARDTRSDPVRAVAAVEELAGEGVVAIVGSPDRLEAQQAVAKAEQLGVPFLELSPDEARRGELIFKLVRPRTAAAQALVRAAQKGGARSVAVLAPDSAYGRSMAQAIAEAARLANLRLATEVRYPESATTFVEPVRRLQAAAPDAILIPAPATQLALIAPQLTASGMVRLPNVKPTGKIASLYATADGINERFLQQTAKYLQGAILAPTFYADLSEPRMAGFVDRYKQAYGEEPSSLDALAWDAVRAVRIALDHGGEVPSRAGLAGQLARLGESGLTGELGFTPTGERAGTPPLYIVDGDILRAVK